MKKMPKSGQISIFVIFIFPILFFIFAVSINVALVVHDKINLQNSVDIAAYYGAMKQAEMLNAIAHINYQIRQSWKLLVWRYRVLGSMGTVKEFGGYNKTDSLYIYRGYENRGISPAFFCVGHKWWKYFTDEAVSNTRGIVTDGDNLCVNIGREIRALHVPSFAGRTLGFLSSMLSGLTRRATSANINLQYKCQLFALDSWLVAILSQIHFREDQTDRKKMIKDLAEKLKQGRDIDNQFIQEGAKKTFLKNLSYINANMFKRDERQFKQFNSLTGERPETWLEDQPFNEVVNYSHFKVDSAGNCEKHIRLSSVAPVIPSNHPLGSALNSIKATLLDKIKPVNSSWPNAPYGRFNTSAGLRKKTNFLIFYSTYAELEYKNQIFLPFGITMKARSLAKPFGGRIGPDKQLDSQLPLTTAGEPNYSRYPGDQLGLNSQHVQYFWNRHITKGSTAMEKNTYNYLKSDFRGLNLNTDKSPLSRLMVLPGGQKPTSLWEVAAVAPDLFDIAYYTILPHYHYSYFPRIQKLLNNADYIRGDLGVFHNGSQFGGETILSQASKLRNPPNIWLSLHTKRSYGFRHGLERPFYKISDINFLLAGWNPPKQKYHGGDNVYQSIDGTKNDFIHCEKWYHDFDTNMLQIGAPITSKGKIPNGCVYGGRSGYSVKMISKKYLKGLTNLMNSNYPSWLQ